MAQTKIKKIHGIIEKLVKGVLTIPKKVIPHLYDLAYDYKEIYFDNEQEFLEFLKEKEEHTVRVILDAKNVKFLEINAKIKARLEKEGYPMDIIENTIENTCLAVVADKKLYLLNQSAMQGLKTKAFSRFDSIPASMKAAFFNATITEAAKMSRQQDQIMPMICCGKIASIMSGIYKPIIPFDFFSIALQEIKKIVGDFRVAAAIVSVVSYKLKVVFTGEKAKELTKIYQERITDYAKRRSLPTPNFKKKNLEFGIIAGTDEAGQGTAFIRPYVNVGRTYGFEVGTPISIYHKGDVDIYGTLSSNVDKIFAIFENVIEKLSNAILIDIKNWRVVIDEVAKELRIPNEVSAKIIVAFAHEHSGTTPVTAYDVMMAILNSSTLYHEEMQPSDTAFGAYEARIAGVLLMDLSKYDFDPYTLEVELKAQPLNDAIRVLTIACQELKMPKTVETAVVSGFESKIALERMMNMGEEPILTSWDVYNAIMGAGKIYREFLVNRSVSDYETKAITFEKTLRKARKLCYVKYDAA